MQKKQCRLNQNLAFLSLFQLRNLIANSFEKRREQLRRHKKTVTFVSRLYFLAWIPLIPCYANRGAKFDRTGGAKNPFPIDGVNKRQCSWLNFSQSDMAFKSP